MTQAPKPTSAPERMSSETKRRLSRLRRRLRQRLGVAFRGPQLDILLSALDKRAGLVREPSCEDYLRWIEPGDRFDKEVEHLLPWVTNHESFFYRHAEQVATFRRVSLEPFLSESRGRPFRVWSAGCAHGEEPYTIAIEIVEALDREPRWPIEILATDLDPQAIDRARRGLYDARAVRALPRRFLGRYFLAEPRGLRIAPSLSERVTFEPHNLLSETPRPEGPFDVIFCRNVLIYFGAAEVNRALDHLVSQLVPGGILMLGPVESLRGRLEDLSSSLQIELDGEVAYYRRRVSGSQAEGRRRGSGGSSEVSDIEQLVVTDRLSEALGRLEAAIARQPRSAEHRLLRSSVFRRLGRYEAGARDCVAVIRDHPLHAEAHRCLSELRTRQGRWDEAMAFSRRTLYLDPEDASAWLLFGDLLEHRRDFQAATRAWMNAHELLECASGRETLPERRRVVLDLLASCQDRLRPDRSRRASDGRALS